MKFFFRLILTFLFIAAMGSQAWTQDKAKQEIRVKESKETDTLAIARLVVGTGVENREPVGAAETFPATTEKVYCFLEATNVSKDTEVAVIWTRGDKEMLKTSLPLKASPKWRTFAFKMVKGLKGDWKVEVKDAGGKILKDVKFKVE
ncbi:MAG: DUF2914 domain-containing protein [Deltaproteobacteria bacterium]|nr:DUF2914 domain-containing protein [Deltaproteobacteria bacterium]